MNRAHQGDTVFASWFTYDTSGKGWWLVATMSKTGANAYSGDLYTVAGARFDAFNPANVTNAKVGTATFTFADGNDATFDYTVQLEGDGSAGPPAEADHARDLYRARHHLPIVRLGKLRQASMSAQMLRAHANA